MIFYMCYLLKLYDWLKVVWEFVTHVWDFIFDLMLNSFLQTWGTCLQKNWKTFKNTLEGLNYQPHPLTIKSFWVAALWLTAAEPRSCTQGMTVVEPSSCAGLVSSYGTMELYQAWQHLWKRLGTELGTAEFAQSLGIMLGLARNHREMKPPTLVFWAYSCVK